MISTLEERFERMLRPFGEKMYLFMVPEISDLCELRAVQLKEKEVLVFIKSEILLALAQRDKELWEKLLQKIDDMNLGGQLNWLVKDIEALLQESKPV